jgi:hypothetical protein
MADASVVGTFDTLDQAEAAVQKLTESGVDAGQISVIANNLQGSKTVHAYVQHGSQAGRGAAIGAGVGAATGGLFTLLLGAAFVWVPIAGPFIVLGPLAAGLTGAVTGAGGGAIVGVLTGAGVPRNEATTYEAAVKEGKFLVVVQGSPAETAGAALLLRGGGASAVNSHAA